MELTGSDCLLLYSLSRSSYLQMLLENYLEVYINRNFSLIVYLCDTVFFLRGNLLA